MSKRQKIDDNKFATPAPPVQGDVKESKTSILDSEEIGKKKEVRKQRQRDEIQQKLKNQGIDLVDDAGGDAIEGYYDTNAEVKKEDGVTIEPFRMDGFFNKEGRYVEQGNEDQDPWYQQWKEQKDTKAYQAPKKQEDVGEKKKRSELELREVLMKFVKPGEMVINAIKRMGKNKSKANPKPKRPWMKNKKKTLTIMSADGISSKRRSKKNNPPPSDQATAMETEVKDEVKTGMTAAEVQKEKLQSKPQKKLEKSEDEQKRVSDLDELSGAAAELMSRGHHNVYQDTFEALKVFVGKAKKQMQNESAEWEYKFGNEDKVHNGFTASKMQRWNKAGYFKNAFVRKTGNAEWLKCEPNFSFS